MNKELKKKWVEALRSGKYRQGLSWLRNEHDEYCCLGVLCDIVTPEAWQEEEVNSPVAEPQIVYSSNGSRALLPRNVQTAADLGPEGLFRLTSDTVDELVKLLGEEFRHRCFKDSSGMYSIRAIELNDGLMLSFDQIATVIERASI